MELSGFWWLMVSPHEDDGFDDFINPREAKRSQEKERKAKESDWTWKEGRKMAVEGKKEGWSCVCRRKERGGGGGNVIGSSVNSSWARSDRPMESREEAWGGNNKMEE